MEFGYLKMEKTIKLTERIFNVKCKFCGRAQKMAIRKLLITNSIKTCVYCGKRFNVYKNVNDNQLA